MAGGDYIIGRSVLLEQGLLAAVSRHWLIQQRGTVTDAIPQEAERR
ncbi:hypothetical protein [Paracoccus sediminilitoris]|nr:hypothetical protein [Paracoccus sediminilitoris]